MNTFQQLICATQMPVSPESRAAEPPIDDSDNAVKIQPCEFKAGAPPSYTAADAANAQVRMPCSAVSTAFLWL